MSDVRLTEERLRNWLDANQAQRERLCLHLLPLLGPYTNVTPRRPKGGRDGARDIPAVFDGHIEVWGAVGFKNSANDSAENKKWVKKKYKSDLKAALKHNTTLKGFLFFTNIDLTPGEQKELIAHATKNGIKHAEIFHRERLRQVLDSPEGLGYRLQYLDIPMSQEEQVAFINGLQRRRENELAELNERQNQINEQVHRLEFLNECLRPVYHVALSVKLNKILSPDELGHFRVAFQVTKICDLTDWYSMCVGGRDQYSLFSEDSNEKKFFGTETNVWTIGPNKTLYTRIELYQTTETDMIWFRAPLYKPANFASVGDFDRTSYGIFMTEPLLKQVDVVAFLVNNYVLKEVPQSLMVTAEEVGRPNNYENNSPEMPGELLPEEENIQWRRIYIRCLETDDTSLSPPRRSASQEIHFNEFTPYRLPIPDEREGSLAGGSGLVSVIRRGGRD